jgi:hypothetical protein
MGWFETVAPNKRFGSFVDGVELFDNAFFGVPQPEAVAMDAQQRILLEASYEALQFSAPRELSGGHSSPTGHGVGFRDDPAIQFCQHCLTMHLANDKFLEDLGMLAVCTCTLA